MQKSTPQRVIRYNNQDLADLNPQATIDEVMRLHAVQIPALATAIVEGPVYEEQKAVYTVSTRIGHKG